MSLTVSDRAKRIATFRFCEVRMMEIVAAWTPRVPEMEVKVMFGRHIWDFARHADALGKRTFELRQPMHFTLPPNGEYLSILDDVADLHDTPSRIAGLYDVVIPGLESRYRRYLEETDHLLDAPSVVTIEQILPDLARQRKDADELRQSLSHESWNPEDLSARESRIETIVA